MRPILVIESDDWGAEHIPSLEALKELGEGDFLRDRFGLFDGLETPDDVAALCDVLGSHKDGDGKPAVITANFIMTNPDFTAIRDANYAFFTPKPIDVGWNHETDADALWRSYKKGIKNNVIAPQLHGVLHFSPEQWLNRLRCGDTVSLQAFRFCMIGESREDNTLGRQSMAPIYHAEDKIVKQRIEEGVNLFNRIFGHNSITTIAPCYGWNSPKTEEEFVFHNVLAMQGKECQYLSGNMVKMHYTGEVGSTGMLYTTRNCMLEPVTSRSNAKQCIEQITQSFHHGLPAIVCSHRVNYVSRVKTEARDCGLANLYSVLKQVVNKFPDVEFLSSDELALRILKQNRNL